MKYDIITIGSATRDVFIKSAMLKKIADPSSETGQSESLPLGSKIEIKELVMASGGGGTNSAVTFARQGFGVACIAVVGEDMEGDEIIKELQAERVNTDNIQKHNDDHTAYSVILVDSAGERTILSYKGEGQHFDVTKVNFDVLEADWFYLDSMGGHLDLFEKAVSYAVSKNIKIACNPGGKELALGWDILQPLLRYIDVYITNKEEAAQLTGIKSDDPGAIMEKLSAVVKGRVIITNGRDGAWLRDADHMLTIATPDAPRVDATGAGDAFGSGFVAEYMRSNDITRALQFATANATSVVGQFGAKAGILKQGDWGPWPLMEVHTL